MMRTVLGVLRGLQPIRVESFCCLQGYAIEPRAFVLRMSRAHPWRLAEWPVLVGREERRAVYFNT